MLGQPRTTQRGARKVASDEGALRGDIVRLASRFGRYGYRRVTDMLRIEGWGVNHKRVERIWRQEGLKVPERQPKRGRLWLNDGSCIRLRPLYRGHVWSYDFVASRTHDGRALKLLTVLDEHTRECLAIVVARKIRAHDVLEVLADLFVRHGPPEYLRSDNGPEFTAKLVRRWLGRVGVEMLFIEPGTPTPYELSPLTDASLEYLVPSLVGGGVLSTGLLALAFLRPKDREQDDPEQDDPQEDEEFETLHIALSPRTIRPLIQELERVLEEYLEPPEKMKSFP